MAVTITGTATTRPTPHASMPSTYTTRHARSRQTRRYVKFILLRLLNYTIKYINLD
jgi:hypothetical protein